MRLLAAFLAGLAATSTPAKPAAQLFVSALDTRPGVSAETDIDLTLVAPTASVDVYVPPGYTIDLGARPGTVIGAAQTTVASILVVAAPGVWTTTGLSVRVERTNDGGYRLECRLAQPAREVELDVQRGLTNPPRGITTWRAFVGGIEARSVVAYPQLLTARSTLTPGALRVSGRLLFAGRPRAGVNVHLAVATREDFQDARELGAVGTDDKGRYRMTRKIPARRQLLLIAYVNFYVGPCSGCLSESISPPPALVTVVG